MLRRVGGWVAVWVASLATYLLFVVTTVPEELAAGAVVATVSTFAIAVVHRYEPVPLRPLRGLRWLAGCWRVPFQVVVETGWLAAALWGQAVRGRPIRGGFRTVPFPSGDPPALANTRHVLATTIGSLAPNTYVVGIEGGRALIHQLLPGGGDPIPRALLEPDGASPGAGGGP